jgi:ferredoxin
MEELIHMAKKKVRIVAEACIGCGCCVGVYPDDYKINDSGLAEVVTGEGDEESASVCPVGAILVEE